MGEYHWLTVTSKGKPDESTLKDQILPPTLRSNTEAPGSNNVDLRLVPVVREGLNYANLRDCFLEGATG